MNILQVVPEMSAGGVERTAIEIAQALTDAGHTAHVASAGGRLEGELAAAGGILHTLPMATKNPVKLRGNTRALIKLIKDHKIDLVHARSRAPAWSAHAAARACGVPFVTTYHGIYNAKSKLKRRYNAIMTKGDIIIANSEFTREHIMAEHHMNGNNIVVVPRGVDMARFDPAKVSAEAAQSLRESWGVKPGQSCLLLPGRLTKWKGQLVAVKALAEIREDQDAVLVLLGDAQGREDYVTEIEVLAEGLSVADAVKIPGHSADMPTAIMASDIVISASTDPEAFGRIAAEGQAMGRWVVATDHGGARETIINGRTGTRVPPGDAFALAQACITALGLTPNAKMLRAHIEENFSDTQLKAAVLGVYTRLLTPQT